MFGTIEPCRSFRLAYQHGRPAIRPARRKCLFLYFHFVDREFGFLHVRTIQVYVNGHEWLARQLDRRGLRYRRLDNAFVWLEDPARVQRADRFAILKWPARLDTLARRVNPLLGDLLASYRYYWATNQAEYATDVFFKNRPALRDLYPRLLRHATLCLSAEDVLTFLGRKLHGRFAGEVLNEWKRPWPGARVKHWMKENWIKLYDKHGRPAGGDGHQQPVRVQGAPPGGAARPPGPWLVSTAEGRSRFFPATWSSSRPPTTGTSTPSRSWTIPPARITPLIDSPIPSGTPTGAHSAPSTPPPVRTSSCSRRSCAANRSCTASATANSASASSAPPVPIGRRVHAFRASSRDCTFAGSSTRFLGPDADESRSSATP